MFHSLSQMFPRKSRNMWISDFPPPLFCCNGEAWLGVEGTTPFLGTHRDVPRENQIKPECLFPCVCVCVEGEDSLLIWLLQSVVFPVVCWCFRQWLWGIEIQPLKWLYILWKSCYKVLMRQIFVLPRRALWLVKGDSYCHAGENSYHVYQCCASVSLCTLWSFFNLCWGVGGTISLCMFTPAGAQLGRLRTLRKYIWKYFQSKLSCRHIKCVYALL